MFESVKKNIKWVMAETVCQYDQTCRGHDQRTEIQETLQCLYSTKYIQVDDPNELPYLQGSVLKCCDVSSQIEVYTTLQNSLHQENGSGSPVSLHSDFLVSLYPSYPCVLTGLWRTVPSLLCSEKLSKEKHS